MPARGKSADRARSVRRTPAAATRRERALPEDALAETRNQLAATSEILRVISRSRTDVQPVFDTIAAAALRLCGASSANVFTYDGSLVHLAALVNLTGAGADAIRSLWPRPPSRELAAGRAILTRGVVEIPDVVLDADFTPTAAAAVAGNFRSILAVPLMREGRPIGAIAVGRPEAGAFPESHVALLQTFAEQAVIAIENVRLFKALDARNRDLTEALEQQTATSDILRVISRSPTATQPVFDTIVGSVLSLCDAAHSGVYLLDGDTLSLAATAGLAEDVRAAFERGYPRKVGADTVSGRAALECRVVQTHDLLADPMYDKAPGSWVGARTVLAVPLMRDGKAIGSIGVWRAEAKPFSDSQVALLRTFADQAVIAIENVRLFTELEARNRELRVALERQTATSEVLKVIGRSAFDLQPVFETLVENAVNLCEASRGLIFRLDDDLLRIAVTHNVSPELRAFFEANPLPLSRASNAGRAALERRTIHNRDVRTDPEYSYGGASVDPYRTVLAVPMLKGQRVLGVITIYRHEVRPFTDNHVALIETFADQAVIAIENVRLFRELKERTAQLTRSVDELKALGEVGRAVSSTLNLETVLATIVSRATGLAGLDGGSIWEYDDAREEFELRATNRLPDDLVEVLRATPIKKGEGALGRLAVTGEPVEIADIANERSYPTRLRELLTRRGYRSVLAVPLLREDQLLGALAVNRNSPGGFEAETIDLLKTFATQSTLAIHNARLFREIEQKSRELEAASRHKSEFLANMSHELRTPLNAVIGFSEVLREQLFGPINEKQADYLADILESGRHLLSLINDILDLSKIEAGRMELEASEFDLPRAIENALILVRERASRHGIELVDDVDPGLGAIRADERKVKQVLLNLLTNALKFTPDGGRVEVRARAVDGAAEISVADTGVGIAPEDQAAVFEEFRQVGAASKKAEGTGLGLAISRKFIELHGGRIGVTSEPGQGSTFAFTLPLR
jgi:signal transduction histidine kinase